jgi:AcrR family transcriptional regulator
MKGDSSTLSRREKLRLLQRETILEAAEQVFARRGYHQSKMREIAAQADFTPGSLYNYFRSKEDIFLALFDRRSEVLYRRLEACLDEELDFFSQIQRLGAVHVSFMDQHRSFFTLFVSAGFGAQVSLPFSVSQRSGHEYQIYVEFLEELIAQGIAQQALRKVNPKTAATAFLAMINSAIYEWCQQDPPVTFAHKLPEVLDLFFFGIHHPSASQTPKLDLILSPAQLEKSANAVDLAEDGAPKTKWRGR